MVKHVIVIASGVTERRALPYLLAHLQSERIVVDEVRIPPRNGALNVEMAEKLVKATWYERVHNPPDKFVILVDVDGKAPTDVLRPFQERLPTRLNPEIPSPLFAFAQWHLEAWYFADGSALRDYLGRALGSIDSSNPDEIQNPKLCLKHLLGDRPYTVVVAEEIAKTVSAATIASRSPSFLGFLSCVRNGHDATSAAGTIESSSWS